MKYIWILMLIMFDVIWFISSIIDVIHSCKYVKEHKILYPYYDVRSFIDRVILQVQGTTIGFITLHVSVLFIISLIKMVSRNWRRYKMISEETTNKEAIEFIKIDISRLWSTPQNLEHKEALEKAIKALEQEPCDDWYDVPSDEMTLGQARRAVKDLRKKLSEHLEQEPILDKIRAEVELKEKTLTDKYGQQKYGIWTDNVLEIIDKYKTKSEDKE